MNIRPGLPALPDAMRGCKFDHRGFPVPWFVTRKDADGRWDFVNIEAKRFSEAYMKRVCWVSGQPLGRYASFVVGPMCVINRVSGDPAMKREVAEWSVKVCPFLTRPRATRAEQPAEVMDQQRGVMIERNPGVSAIYTTRDYELISAGVYALGNPTDVTWWREGRPATFDEVEESLVTGLPTLIEMAAEEGPEALSTLQKMANSAYKLLPAA